VVKYTGMKNLDVSQIHQTLENKESKWKLKRTEKTYMSKISISVSGRYPACGTCRQVLENHRSGAERVRCTFYSLDGEGARREMGQTGWRKGGHPRKGPFESSLVLSSDTHYLSISQSTSYIRWE
jgi:LSD1 subclass zinc finger protein